MPEGNRAASTRSVYNVNSFRGGYFRWFDLSKCIAEHGWPWLNRIGCKTEAARGGSLATIVYTAHHPRDRAWQFAKLSLLDETGFGVSVVTIRDDPAAPLDSFGWDGGLGTIWRSDPREDMVTILMTQCNWASPLPSNVCLDFRTTAYQAIDD